MWIKFLPIQHLSSKHGRNVLFQIYEPFIEIHVITFIGITVLGNIFLLRTQQISLLYIGNFLDVVHDIKNFKYVA